MPMRRHLLSSLAIALLLSAPVFAQMPGPHRPANPERELSKRDMEFIKNAAIGGKAEVELGKLAQQNAQSPQVKEFGARMEKDHSAADAQLTAIATGKGARLPQQLDAEHMRMRDRLAQLHGEAFDRAYMRAMVEDYDKALKAFSQEGLNGHDPEIKRFARDTLSVIKQHDRMALEIDRSLTAVGSSRSPR